VTGDQIVEKGADRLQELANRAAARGDGVGEWLSKELRDDAAFLRKLKPSLIAARARGEAPTDGGGAQAPPAAAAPPELTAQPPKPKSKGKRSGPPPIAIVAAAFVAGIVLAKVVDWRGHAHPRD
jgi:hypothetical protein